MKEIALPTTNFAENAVMTVSRVSAVSWCSARSIYRKGERRTMMKMENEMNVNVPLEIIKASEIEPKEVKWLWYPYIPFGKVTLLQGDPGDGKSKLMLSIAALLSKGEPLPFTEEETEPMTVIYQTTEDDADDTVVPRFNSAGGNGENLIFIKEDEKSLSFGDNRIAEAIKKYLFPSPGSPCNSVTLPNGIYGYHSHFTSFGSISLAFTTSRGTVTFISFPIFIIILRSPFR